MPTAIPLCHIHPHPFIAPIDSTLPPSTATQPTDAHPYLYHFLPLSYHNLPYLQLTLPQTLHHTFTSPHPTSHSPCQQPYPTLTYHMHPYLYFLSTYPLTFFPHPDPYPIKFSPTNIAYFSPTLAPKTPNPTFHPITVQAFPHSTQSSLSYFYTLLLPLTTHVLYPHPTTYPSSSILTSNIHTLPLGHTSYPVPIQTHLPTYANPSLLLQWPPPYFT